MELSAKYNPSDVEEKWYSYWLKNKFFHSEPDSREPYTVVIPPPNVTGVLHMGHMLNNTIQDVLVRRARMQGKNACWVPGTDHASIATEAKVVAKLKEQDRQVLPDPRGVHETCLGMEGEARRHHPRAAQEARGLLRLGPYPLYDGSGSQ